MTSHKTPLLLALIGFLSGFGAVWNLPRQAERPAFAPAYQHCLECGRPHKFTRI